MKKFKELIDRIKEVALPIAVGASMLGINVIAAYYIIKSVETKGGKIMAVGIEGIHKGSPQIQPWLTVYDTDGDGIADSTNVIGIGPGGGALSAYRRKSTQAEIEWYKSQK